MSAERWRDLEELFHAARALDAGARAALRQERCADDPALWGEVERLLAADDRAAGFIELPAVATLDLLDDGAMTAGRRIGPYRIVREIGRGGMGAVYLAERADGAFAQRVAVKLVKRGMDTDQVLARSRTPTSPGCSTAGPPTTGCRTSPWSTSTGGRSTPSPTPAASPSATASGSSCRCVTPSPTPTARGWFTATSSRSTSS
jgi:hypothetical protein